MTVKLLYRLWFWHALQRLMSFTAMQTAVNSLSASSSQTRLTLSDTLDTAESSESFQSVPTALASSSSHDHTPRVGLSSSHSLRQRCTWAQSTDARADAGAMATSWATGVQRPVFVAEAWRHFTTLSAAQAAIDLARCGR